LSEFTLRMLHGSGLLASGFSELLTIVGGTVLMGFVPAVLLSMYYDLKLRKGGADLASRVDALAPQ
jgi:hypothetical protein